ncbi:unnamed protein product [Citrullus colocynthis]|uniref:Uncharacterized protein n=1 Tax=Citrullus colocynthis TaxID=252529 RepID=A0ABP0YUL3_9ROSI
MGYVTTATPVVQNTIAATTDSSNHVPTKSAPFVTGPLLSSSFGGQPRTDHLPDVAVDTALLPKVAKPIPYFRPLWLPSDLVRLREEESLRIRFKYYHLNSHCRPSSPIFSPC